jgi:ribonuclease-3
MSGMPFYISDVTEEQLDLFCSALTHSSYSNENIDPDTGKPAECYERLEFLGDSVIELVVREHLFRSTEWREGQMTAKKQEHVSDKDMSSHVLESGMDLDSVMLLGNGHKDSEGNNVVEESMRAGAFEALAGAFYLSRGLEFARRIILIILRPDVTEKSE